MELTGFGGKLNVREFGRVAQWPDPARREFLETFPDAIRMAAGQQSKTLPGILLRSCGMPSAIYTVECMMERWQIEIEPEVRDWLELLPFRLYRGSRTRPTDCWTSRRLSVSRIPGTSVANCVSSV